MRPAESSSSKAGDTGEGNDEFGFAMYFFHTSKGSLTCRKILGHGASGFNSPPKEGVLRNFIALGRFEHAKLFVNIMLQLTVQ
jgi:hypothetical protein